ncbi:uncharacterized protein M6B38_331950 [Iris pallida]|uniref:Uncharacterized protein n=1 Tax=Iris pallida TaxID=29817 RepID=A0AAX6H4I1_IRIPA|nr:uncharacterized protein M6B38_331950 [Iris pallida]
MEAAMASSVSPSTSLLVHHRRLNYRHPSLRFTASMRSTWSSFSINSSSSPSKSKKRRRWLRSMASAGVVGEGEGEEEEVERALGMDGSVIPSTADELVKRVSSKAYDMRRHLNQSLDSISYDVLETNPWRDDTKPVYVLTHKDNQLCTMKTRQNRSEVERELGLLFSKGGRRGLGIGNKAKQSGSSTNFNMFVEDIREGVLVFEDEHDATRYCDLLEGGGQGCEGIAELEASSVFDICNRMRALAVIFRRGRTPPLPKSLEQNLRARKRSLEDQDLM